MEGLSKNEGICLEGGTAIFGEPNTNGLAMFKRRYSCDMMNSKLLVMSSSYCNAFPPKRREFREKEGSLVNPT